MKDKKQQEPITIKTERATIIIYPPKTTEEERERILKEIARLKATW